MVASVQNNKLISISIYNKTKAAILLNGSLCFMQLFL